MPTELARAKINLNLHVGRLVEDPKHPYFGYHPLSSLVVFADYGDDLSCEEAADTSLTISGPFSKGLETDSSNLILRAYEAVSAIADVPALKFHLIKKLPIASGIGGGSADAAAALRLLMAYVDLPEKKWQEIALTLGADVPVCLSSKTCIMSGIGEKIEFLPGLGQLPALLINPGISVATGAIFKLFDQETRSKKPRPQLDKGSIVARCRFGRNDLTKPAIKIAPEIQSCLDAAQLSDGCTHRKMSGSGATCYGLFDNGDSARIAANKIQTEYPNWWVQPVMLGDAP